MKHAKKLVLFTLFAMNLVDQQSIEVVIEQGILTGKVSDDGSFFEYIGIPYATTNSSLRFKAPLPPPNWDGVFRAIQPYYCPQNALFGLTGIIIGTEDCLKINVYVPVMAKRPIPVMVYIHGGAFMFGSGGKLFHGPDFLVNQGVILVTFNYRLGALGFTCLNIEDAPGNAGLKDQIAALRWVKKNIAAFGGDPNSVTIFGESAGATSASVLLASETTEGLFQRMIVQSGTSIASWSINRNPIWTASLLARNLGYKTEDPKELYEIFTKLPLAELINTKVEKPIDLYLDLDLIYLPCIEKKFPGIESVLTDLPYNLFKTKPKNISVIYGSTKNEGLLLIYEDKNQSHEKRNDKYLFASDLKFESQEEAALVAKRVHQFYFGDKLITKELVKNVSDFYTHIHFEIPMILESELLLEKSNASVYNYYFNYSGGRNYVTYYMGNMNVTGANHADDILYLFNGKIWPFWINKQDQIMINWMTKMWTNFAKYGNPTPEVSSDIPVTWVRSSKNHLKYLYIDDELKMGSIPNPKAYELWKDIYTRYRNKKIN